jgi:hypothetical protein
MGKRGQRRTTKKAETDELMEALFSPIPKAKRDELNQLAESLLTLVRLNLFFTNITKLMSRF